MSVFDEPNDDLADLYEWLDEEVQLGELLARTNYATLGRLSYNPDLDVNDDDMLDLLTDFYELPRGKLTK